MWLTSIVGCLLVVNKVSTSRTTQNLPQHPSAYQFGYTVRADETSDYKTHHEVSDGKEVRGVYSLGEPNGDLRVVNYTADRVNGFRAMVSVHPGASPTKLKARKQQTDTGTDQHSLQTTNLPHAAFQVEQSTSGEQLTSNRTNEENTNIQDNINTTNNKVKLFNATLFDILPGLDKHVPKIEYIVEEDYGDNDGTPLDLKNTYFNSSNKSQVIPINVEEDPYDKSLELVETDSGVNTDSFTKVNNENLSTQQPGLQHSLKEEVISRTATSDKETKTKNTQDILQLISSTVFTLPSDQTNSDTLQTLAVKDNTGNAVTDDQIIKYTTDKSLSDKLILKLSNTVENQTLQQHSTKSKPNFTTTIKNQIKHEVIEPKRNEFLKPADTSNDTRKTEEPVLRPDNNIILAALMLPSPPIIKFTCMPDIPEGSSVKVTPIMPNASPTLSNYPPQYPVRNAPTMSNLHGIPVLPPPKNTVRTPTNPIQQQPNNNRLYPLTSVHFTSKSGLFKLTPFTEPNLYFTRNSVPNASYNPTSSGSSRVDQQKTTLSVETTVEITPPPTKRYSSLRNNGNPSHNVQNFIHNRESPLYPIPYPWIYHPVRPSHNYHPRHLPVFVLPMSHNVNFARTFDPQLIDKHNN